MRSCRLGFSMIPRDPSLQFEVLSQVHLTDLRVGKNLIRRTLCQHGPLTYYVGTAANSQRFAHIMVGDEHADALIRQVFDYPLDICDREGVDAGEGLVEQDE